MSATVVVEARELGVARPLTLVFAGMVVRKDQGSRRWPKVNNEEERSGASTEGEQGDSDDGSKGCRKERRVGELVEQQSELLIAFESVDQRAIRLTVRRKASGDDLEKQGAGDGDAGEDFFGEGSSDREANVGSSLPKKQVTNRLNGGE